jgi:hypothetical protein
MIKSRNRKTLTLNIFQSSFELIELKLQDDIELFLENFE